MRNYHLILGLFIFLCLSGCAEEEERPLPYVQVNFSILLSAYPELMQGIPLKIQQRYEGYNKNGIILVPEGYDSYQYTAYDATCTRDITSETMSLNVDANSLTATCPRCKTVYNISTGGYSTDGKSHLQRYNAVRSYDRIYVTN